MKDELKSIQQRHKEWINIVNRGDAEAYAGLLAEDAVWFPPTGDPIVGRDAFSEWLSPFFSRFEYDFTITNERFRIAGDRAVEKGTFTSVMSPVVDGDPMEHSGTFTVLWRCERQQWYIERYIDDTDI